jgi:hypothetical protein
MLRGRGSTELVEKVGMYNMGIVQYANKAEVLPEA